MIAVPCRYWDEGETDLTVGTFEEVGEPSPPHFETVIRTPSRIVEFTGLPLTKDRVVVYLSLSVSKMRTRIRIWTDGLMLPEKVSVAIGD